MTIILRRAKYFLLVLVGTAAFAAVPATPLASAAAKTQTVDDATCAEWAGWFNSDFADYGAAVRAGNTQAASDALGKMKWDYQTAHDAGCDWAAKTASPGSTTTVAIYRTSGPVAAAH